MSRPLRNALTERSLKVSKLVFIQQAENPLLMAIFYYLHLDWATGGRKPSHVFYSGLI